MRSIEILGETYSVIEYSEELSEDTDGHCCPERMEIHLRKSIRDTETLLHEINHGILFQGGLFCAIEPGLREVICQQIAQEIAKNFYLRFKK